MRVHTYVIVSGPEDFLTIQLSRKTSSRSVQSCFQKIWVRRDAPLTNITLLYKYTYVYDSRQIHLKLHKLHASYNIQNAALIQHTRTALNRLGKHLPSLQQQCHHHAPGQHPSPSQSLQLTYGAPSVLPPLDVPLSLYPENHHPQSSHQSTSKLPHSHHFPTGTQIRPRPSHPSLRLPLHSRR